ncbi:aerobic carbon monoxide dehydrogenase [Halosimplex carlsbadense 2-9-1]|uniref:Aerobic carbon monoxide dehydrogenase n=1 Tax=Halosimplex carlsbadense 2-9-1 TaxID=797114 RepID=M0C9L2_9EURY|nr:xanthine dehydrogenase family protein subunit M [Halosimplex carlsbadense]ELZ19966.1 aerobic carbon monoxide dehydrogenase [Halosimplex carlsbadense 2-9-1]
MKPSPFQYHRPDTVEEAAALLEELPDAELMAGNQSLSIVMSNRLANPDHIVDINGIDELAYIDSTDDAIEVGALTRHRNIDSSPVLSETYPVLSESAGQIAGPVVRNRGTIGGSIGEADPAGNYPCVLVATGGELELASADGRRTVDAADYFVAYMMTAIEENELITAVRFPRDPFPVDRTGMTFLGQKRAAQTWPTLSIACAVRVDDPAADDPVVEEARVGLANAADVPLRVADAEAAVEGDPLSEGSLEAAGEVAYDRVRPQDEMHADETYKRELSRTYTKRALTEAYDRAVQ